VHCVRDNEILLIDPNGDEADRVTWGDGGGNEVMTDASLERTGFGDGDPWVAATAQWPGSAGDLGSPGQAYGAQPATTDIPTETPTPAASPMPTDTPAQLTPPPRIFISEFMANPAAVNDSVGE
jgi:hypothetical protein